MPYLVAASGPRAGARFDVAAELIIGRSPSCEIALPDDGKVSRRHARLRSANGGCVVVDLGSRNGTWVNGDRIEGEVALAPGDRVQIGDTSFLFDPPVRATVDDAAEVVSRTAAVEEFLPASGEAGALFRAATALIGSPSEAVALRRGAEEALRMLSADVAAALLAGEQGLFTAAVVGAPDVKVGRALLRAAVERREAARYENTAAAPLWSGGAAFGLLYVERSEGPLTERELGLLGAVGRLCGEAMTAARARQPAHSEDVLVGTSRVFRKAVDAVRKAATQTGAVSLFGECGTGKELLATYLHARSSRSSAPCVRIQCRGPHVEEELFGRAAVPGAPPRPPALVRADGGTLVLDGVEALPRPLADRLARTLRQQSATLPDGTEAACDVRVIACTREPLGRLTATGAVDPELARLLDAHEVGVPPLRDRRTDIPLLFEYFAARTARLAGQKTPSLSAEAKDVMLAYAWPGNVRELKLFAERVAVVFGGVAVQPAHLPPELRGEASAPGEQKLQQAVARLEREVIADALKRARGKKIKAAELLGISRPTLDKKIAAYKLAVK